MSRVLLVKDDALPHLHYTPTPEHLLTLVQRRPMIALREISHELWPYLSWLPATPGGDSATGTVRAFPAGHGTEQKPRRSGCSIACRIS